MGNILNFPKIDLTEPPDPFDPDTAVMAHLENACTEVISTRIPYDLKRNLMQQAFVSKMRFSHFVASVLCQHAWEQRKRCNLKIACKEKAA